VKEVWTFWLMSMPHYGKGVHYIPSTVHSTCNLHVVPVVFFIQVINILACNQLCSVNI